VLGIGLILKIEHSLLIRHETRIETAADVAAVSTRYGKALFQRGLSARPLSAQRLSEISVQTAAALKEKSAVPVIR
jgi:hypothetical protein